VIASLLQAAKQFRTGEAELPRSDFHTAIACATRSCFGTVGECRPGPGLPPESSGAAPDGAYASTRSRRSSSPSVFVHRLIATTWARGIPRGRYGICSAHSPVVTPALAAAITASIRADLRAAARLESQGLSTRLIRGCLAIAFQEGSVCLNPGPRPMMPPSRPSSTRGVRPAANCIDAHHDRLPRSMRPDGRVAFRTQNATFNVSQFAENCAPICPSKVGQARPVRLFQRFDFPVPQAGYARLNRSIRKLQARVVFVAMTFAPSAVGPLLSHRA